MTLKAAVIRLRVEWKAKNQEMHRKHTQPPGRHILYGRPVTWL